MTDTSQDAPKGKRTSPDAGNAGGERDARLRAALRSNIAKRKAQAHAARQPDNPPHGQGGDGPPDDLPHHRDA